MQNLMNSTDISFPNLNIYLKNIPKSFTVFNFEIALYGVFVACAIISGILLAVRQAKKTNQNPEFYWDYALYGIILAIIGSRIFYVIFRWDSFRGNFLSVFNLRTGGLAIYGGVIAAFTTLYVYAKIKKKNFFQMADTAVPGLIIGQIIGRLGNFTNREVFGGYTDNLFAMRLPLEAVRRGDITAEIAANIVEGTNYIQVHPTFLYEMLCNGLVLTITLLYTKHKKFHGEVSLIYFGGYGLARFFIEGIRTDRLWIHGTTIPVNQVLAITLFILSILTWILVRLGRKKGKFRLLNTD